MSLFRQRPRKPAPLKVRRAAYVASRSTTEARPAVGRWVDASSQPPRLYQARNNDDYAAWGYRRRWVRIPWLSGPRPPPPYDAHVYHDHEHVHDHGLGFGTGFSVGMGWMAARLVFSLLLCVLLVALLAGAARLLLRL